MRIIHELENLNLRISTEIVQCDLQIGLLRVSQLEYLYKVFFIHVELYFRHNELQRLNQDYQRQ